eukprot:s2472_g5.t1
MQIRQPWKSQGAYLDVELFTARLLGLVWRGAYIDVELFTARLLGLVWQGAYLFFVAGRLAGAALVAFDVLALR